MKTILNIHNFKFLLSFCSPSSFIRYLWQTLQFVSLFFKLTNSQYFFSDKITEDLLVLHFLFSVCQYKGHMEAWMTLLKQQERGRVFIFLNKYGWSKTLKWCFRTHCSLLLSLKILHPVSTGTVSKGLEDNVLGGTGTTSSLVCLTNGEREFQTVTFNLLVSGRQSCLFLYVPSTGGEVEIMTSKIKTHSNHCFFSDRVLILTTIFF